MMWFWSLEFLFLVGDKELLFNVMKCRDMVSLFFGVSIAGFGEEIELYGGVILLGCRVLSDFIL